MIIVGAHQAPLLRWRLLPGDQWYLDEVFLTTDGARHYLWRAVDQTTISRIFLYSSTPEGPTRALLEVIEKHPQAVWNTVHAAPR